MKIPISINGWCVSSLTDSYEFLHSSWRLKSRSRLKHNAQHLAIGTTAFHVGWHFLVMAPMVPILAAVFEKNAVELLDVVFRERDGLETLKDHAHLIGI